ncbi:MAG: glycosyltransferase family 2 protein [Bacteroidota bacterium]|uniref:Glycosyltransferase family 2 protein n=1 Tax=Flagellimonas profundi TaxID=2915620 RepID=A0ABS3FE39_9FLAO|nr:glycosyltransferase family 2 protein [Allomuricauda profundi]MBO0340856.1 glycosyltransferase family 2 protein [Allomuricauda profundi]MEC7771977.1 glycosyltransferase family 2 protein [Bacteroidota bacterium]
MQNGKISIIIPFKNTAHYLPECLDSIVNQTYNDWEVLAVNDHSTDKSFELLSSYSKKDERIKVFQNKGTGIIPALQTGYAESHGQFVTRMDSDDIMKPNRLEVMINSLKENGIGHVAVGKVKYFSHRGISNGYERYEQWLNQLTAEGNNFDEIYKECVIPSPCWMAHREDFEKCNGFEPHRYPEDYDLTFRFYEHALKIIPCHQVLHLWRDYDTRTSRTHEHYAQNYFLDIKLHYFLKLDHDIQRPLVVWGAGFKGKKIAKGLKKKGLDFVWLCDNPNKIGKKIYGKVLVHFEALQDLKNPQSIITVANEDAQQEIRSYFSELGQSPMQDYFFFC